MCGKSVAREMAKLTPVRLLTEALTPAAIGDELEFAALHRLLPSPAEARELAAGKQLAGTLLQLANKQLEPMHAGVIQFRCRRGIVDQDQVLAGLDVAEGHAHHASHDADLE